MGTTATRAQAGFAGLEAPERWPRSRSAPRADRLAASVESIQGVGPTMARRLAKVGLRTLDIEEIPGTAVGGGAQRGGDFLPLKASRTNNWQARWQRLRAAQDKLAVLPPIDVFKFGDRYHLVQQEPARRALDLRQIGEPNVNASL